MHITRRPETAVPACLLALGLLLASCGSGDSPVAVSPVSTPTEPLTVSALTVSGCAVIAGTCSGLEQGDTLQLLATATMSDGASKNVTTAAQWSSSNTAVATVSDAGVVTHVGTGTADILATYQSKGAGQTISIVGVTKITVAGLSCNGAATTLASAFPTVCTSPDTGGTVRLFATATYGNGLTKDVTAKAVWTSSDTRVLTVDQSGVVTATGFGDATVTASVGNVSGSQVLRSPARIAASPVGVEIYYWGGQASIMVTTSPSNVPWRIDSDMDWLTVEPRTGTGNARISLTAGSCSASRAGDRGGRLTIVATKGLAPSVAVGVYQARGAY